MRNRSRRCTLEKIDRETVARVLSQHEVVQLVAQYRSQLLAMVSKAIGVFDQALLSDDERVRVAAATKLLEGLGVLPKAGIEQPAPEPDRAQQKQMVLGQMTEAMLTKQQLYGLPLPPGLDGIEKHLAERMGV